MTEFERGEREFEWEQDNGYPSHDDYLYLNRRKDNLKKYFLDPNCIESLQDEIIRLKKELEGIQVNTKTEYNEIPKKDERFDNSKIKDELLYTIKEASKLSHIACRTIQRRCIQNSLKKTGKRYLITGMMLKEWVNISLHKTEGTIVQSYQIPKKVERPILKNLGRVVKSPSEYSLKGLNKQQIQEYTKRNTKKSINTKTYLIKNRRNGFYKIGRSKDPLKREQTLQSEEPDIVMVKTWDEDIENKLHIEYKDYRIRGEWFELSKAQVKYICTNYERS